MALYDDIAEGVKKVFLAGVGAVAIGAEKSQELIDDLIKKGELTVEQGKSLNEELTRKVKETTSNASDEVLKAKFRGMTPEERAEWIAKAQKISDDIANEPVEAEVEEAEYEVVSEEEAPEEAAEPEVTEEPVEGEEA